MEEYMINAKTHIEGGHFKVTLTTKLELFGIYNGYWTVYNNSTTLTGNRRRVNRKVDRAVRKARRRYARIIKTRETDARIPDQYDLRTS